MILGLLIGKFLPGVNDQGFNVSGTVNEFHGLCQTGHPDHVELVDNRRLAGIVLRKDDALVFFLAGLNGYGQYPLDGTQPAIQRQLAQDHVLRQTLSVDLFGRGQDGQGDGQIIGRAFLAQIRRSEIHHEL